MKMRKAMIKIYYMLGLLAAILVAGCSESLEDTYDEYIEGGMVRYLGKCADVEVNPGWERLQVIWKNNIDAAIKQVKITWQSENEETPFVRYIDRPTAVDEGDLMDTIFLEGLQDAVYTVRVINVAADSTESLVEEKYGRPYTESHEDLRTFTRGMSAFGRMGDKLAVVLDQYNENIDSMVLCFYEVGKNEQTMWNMKEHMNNTLSYSYYGMNVNLGRDYLFLLPEEPDAEIDFSRPLTIKRKGKLEGCIDEISFQDEALNLNERLWSTEFSQLMLEKYGFNWENEVENVKTIELDYDVASMQDLMYFPSLEKVILGKNRYMESTYISSFKSTTDEYIGLVMLSFLAKTHPNFVVERYNSHYFGNDPMWTPYIDAYKKAGKIDDGFTIVEKGATNMEALPQYTPLDTTGWEITCSDTTHNGYTDNGAAWLLYDAEVPVEVFGGVIYQEVYFEPQQTLGASIVTVTYDMKEPQVVKGFKVAQPIRNQRGDTDDLLSSLMIEFSTDGYSWVDATYTDGSVTIGASPGEQTFVYVPQELQTPVRYIRISMSSRSVSTVSGQGIYNLRLGKFIPLEELTLPNP